PRSRSASAPSTSAACSAASPEKRPQADGHGSGSGSAGPVELGVDRARGLRRKTRDALELLLRGRDEALGGAEVLQQRAPTRRADARQLVEDRAERLRVAPLPVAAGGEPVRLVADPLQELQARPRAGPQARIPKT